MVHPCDKPCGNKTASGYCATTVCINSQYSNIGTVQYGQGVQKRIITNADRIRSMTDEELAEFMALNTDCYYCRAKDNDRCASLATTPCGDIWLDWLKQEADDDKSGQDQRDDG